MPDTSCSLVVAMVPERVLHPDGHEPSEGNILQYVPSKLYPPSKEYPTHDDHWLHSWRQFAKLFENFSQRLGSPPLECSQR